MCVCMCVIALTADAISVVVRSIKEMRQRHQQRGQTGQQSTTSDEPWAVDTTPQETHKDDEDRVPHLESHNTRG